MLEARIAAYVVLLELNGVFAGGVTVYPESCQHAVCRPGGLYGIAAAVRWGGRAAALAAALAHHDAPALWRLPGAGIRYTYTRRGAGFPVTPLSSPATMVSRCSVTCNK